MVPPYTPRFSLVVPTLQRPDTLRHTLATLIAQNGGDIEIVVQNNGGDQRIKAVVDDLADPRVRHFWSSGILTMSENWEMGLQHTRGDFVTFIGDDDGLFPDACQIAGTVLDRTGAQILSWFPFCYYWPDYVHPELRNRLIAVVDDNIGVRMVQSSKLLRRVYGFSANYAELPMIYNSFVARRVIEAVIAEHGRYFVGRACDVVSGIVNAVHAARFARISRPLSMTGLSHHSTGHNTYLAARGRVSQQETERDMGAAWSDERLVPAENLQIFLAEEMLYVRDRSPAIKDALDLGYRGLMVAMASAINDRPGSYDETLAAIQLLARRHGIDLSGVVIPPRSDVRPVLAAATQLIGGHVHYVVDGNAEKLATIADAIAWMWRRMPRADAANVITIEEEEPDVQPVLRPGEKMTFAHGTEGSTALEEGWGEPEAWGTWSVAKWATLRFRVDAAPPLRLRLGYRVFIFDRHPSLDVVCRSKAGIITSWRCAAWSGVAVLALSSVAADGLIELEFEISDPRSPAEFGLSPDARTLGIGLEWLDLSVGDPIEPTLADDMALERGNA